MNDQRPVLYHRLLERDSRRVRRAARLLMADIDRREITLLTNRRELVQLCGALDTPCLAVSTGADLAVIDETEEIIQFLLLRFGGDDLPEP